MRDLGFILLVALGWFLIGSLLYRWAPVEAFVVHALGRDHYPRVWDAVFHGDTNQYVLLVTMKDGQTWVGSLLRASDFPGERELLLLGPGRLMDDGRVIDVGLESLLVTADNVHRIFLMDKKRYEEDQWRTPEFFEALKTPPK